MIKLSLWNLGASFALLGLLSTGMWAVLTPTMVAVALFLLVVAYGLLRLADWPEIMLPFVFVRRDLYLSVLLLLPLLVYALCGWSSEFPFSGDHDHHIFANESARVFWTANWPYLFGFIIAIFAAAKWSPWREWPLIILAGFVVAVPFAPVPLEYFARYPATGYLLSQPFQLFLGVWNADRMPNLLAPLVWLLFLRPLLFGRRGAPGWAVLATLVLWQKDFIFFIDSVYLEAWPLVFLALALEALFLGEVWWPAFLSAAACAFKDTAAIPFLFLSTAVLVRHPREWKKILAMGTLGLLPFIIYYLERRAVGVWRTLEITPMAEWLTPRRIELLDFRLDEQFRAYGLIALIAVIFFGLFPLEKRRPWIWSAVIIFAGGVAQIWLYFADRISLPYPGYPRLGLMAWLMLIAPAMMLSRKFAYAAAALLALSFAPPLFEEIQLLRGPAYARDFREDYGVPLYFPMRTLMAKNQSPTVRLILSTAAAHPGVIPLVYRDLFAGIHLEAYPAAGASPYCRCAPGVSLLIMTAHARNLRLNAPSAPYSFAPNEVSDACWRETEQSCNCITEGDPAEGRLCSPK